MADFRNLFRHMLHALVHHFHVCKTLQGHQSADVNQALTIDERDRQDTIPCKSQKLELQASGLDRTKVVSDLFAICEMLQMLPSNAKRVVHGSDLVLNY